jgi:hypothetical protein
MAPREHDETEEARRLLALCAGDTLRAFEIVQGQLSVLVLRTQVMLSLSGIVITVTGFSGKTIAQTSASARYAIVAGLFVVLCAAAVGVGGVLRLKWLTQELQADPVETIKRGLEIRNRKAGFLSIALALFIAGFALYCASIAQLLLAA